MIIDRPVHRLGATRWFDRPFAGASGVFVAGPIAPPAVDDVRDVVARVLAVAPDGPLALRVVGDRAERRRRFDTDALAAQLVVGSPHRIVGATSASRGAVEGVATAGSPGTDGDGAADAAAARAELAAGCDDLPALLTVGADHAVLELQHVVGDAVVMNAAITGVLAAAAGAPLPDGLVRPTSPRVLAATLAALHRVRPMPRTAAVPSGRTASGRWRLVHGVAHTAFPEQVLRGLKRAARGSGVRRSSLMVALVEQALREHGLVAGDGVRTAVIDCRRYLPPDAVVRGNFSAGDPLTTDWTDPVALDAEISRSIDRGRPLAQLVWSAGTAVLSRRDAAGVRPALPGSPVRPDYSMVGMLRGMTRLPWTGRPVYVAAPRPYRPETLGVLSLEVGSALQLTFSYDRGTVDREAVDAAMASARALFVAAGSGSSDG